MKCPNFSELNVVLLDTARWLIGPVVWATAFIGFIFMLILHGIDEPITIEPGNGLMLARLHLCMLMFLCMTKILYSAITYSKVGKDRG